MNAEIDTEIMKQWKLLIEIILVRLDDDLDGIKDIYSFRSNDKVSSILNTKNLSIVDRRYEIFLFELDNYKSLIRRIHGDKNMGKYLNIQDALSGRTLLDMCKYGVFGMKGGVTFFVSGDWKIDSKIYNLLVSNKVGSNLKGGKIKSHNNRKFKNNKSLKKRS